MLRKKNPNWIKQYDSIKKRLTLRQRLWHLIVPPGMQDPDTNRVYRKYDPEGVYITTLEDSPESPEKNSV